MHTAGTGPIKTFVAIGFVVVIPLIAVFGIPERESVVASSGGDDTKRVRQHSVGVGESARFRSDDLFADFPRDAAVKTDSDSADQSLSVTVTSSDPFQTPPSASSISDDPFMNQAPSVPAIALAGWSLQQSDESSSPVVGGFASRIAGSPRAGNSAAPMPRDIKTTRSIPRAVSTQDGSGPRRFRHRHDEPFGQSTARSKDVPKVKSSAPQTWRAAVRRLNELGIHHFRLEPGRRPSEFHFHCSLTPSDTPRITQRFEAESAEPLRAVQKVIAQVEQWLQRR